MNHSLNIKKIAEGSTRLQSEYNVSALKRSIYDIKHRLSNNAFINEAAAKRAPRTIQNLEGQLLTAIEQHNKDYPNYVI